MPEEIRIIISEEEFNGKPILTIKNGENDHFPFSFGLSKAKKILEAFDEIQRFVEKHSA